MLQSFIPQDRSFWEEVTNSTRTMSSAVLTTVGTLNENLKRRMRQAAVKAHLSSQGTSQNVRSTSKPFDFSHSTTSSNVHSDGCVPNLLPPSWLPIGLTSVGPDALKDIFAVVAGVNVCWIPAVLLNPIEPVDDTLGEFPGDGMRPGEVDRCKNGIDS